VAIGTFLGILFCMDILFTVQHWPGANMIWLTTIVVSLFIFIPLYLFTGLRRAENRTNVVLTTIILTGFTGLMFTAISLRPSRHLYENGLNGYLQNEEILKNIERSPNFKVLAADASVADVMQLSKQMKSAILEFATGNATLPENTTAAKLPFRQESLSYMDNYFKQDGQGVKLFEQLQRAALAYSKAHGSIPPALALIHETPGHIGSYDNIYVLNSLTQLQIYLATSTAERNAVALAH
jgi:hypothetical protein